MKKFLIRLFVVVSFVNPAALYLGYKLKQAQDRLAQMDRAVIQKHVLLDECRSREILANEIIEVSDSALSFCQEQRNELRQRLGLSDGE